ncbi:jg25478 [Pararge aegeria aegeria]|uniref:Jg25478 protein n=1 Tax=Pararge aegeria aegeria TaxID=348720 RepID=A0A8S4QTH0_9NEOP|nr:jg25478 [Pararge aegeria aegeria]
MRFPQQLNLGVMEYLSFTLVKNYNIVSDPPSSKKLRTSSLTNDKIVEVNCDMTHTDSVQPNKGIKKSSIKQNNDTKPCGPDDIEKHREILEPELSCEACSYKTWNKEYMVLHKLTHKKEKNIYIFPCIICDYITKDKEILTKHLIEHNGKMPFRCIACEFKCNTPSSLLKHNSSKHPEVTKPFSCNVCEYKAANNSAIVRHTRIHTGEKPFSCKQCPYKCTDSSSLTFHTMQHTGEKPFSCNLCPYRSKCNSTLISHMRRHTGERPFECKGCGYKFTNQSDLMQHVKINTGPELFKCSVCEFSSPIKCALVKHVRTHTGQNTLTCELCMYKCTEKQILVSHMRTHAGDSQYSCTNCDFMCLRKCDLLMHMRTHTEEKPFSCAQCDYKCRGRRTLGNHVRKTHIEPSSKKIRIRRNCSLTTENAVNVHSVITQTHSNKDKLINTSTENNQKPKERTMIKKYLKTSIEQNDTKPCRDDSIEKHKEILEPELYCEICSYRTWNKNYMELHTQIHLNKEENNVFSCIICDYVTKDKQIFLEHLIEHNGKLPFRCIACDFKCNAPSGLLKHNSSTHPEVTKPFSCNVCEYKSLNNSAIIRHTRIHTGEKPFACQQCSYRCTDSTSLTYHMKQHTSEKTCSSNPKSILVKNNN